MAETKGGTERIQEQQRAAAAVRQALRHADVRGRVELIRVQREPFEGNGERAEAFAPGTRFPKERLWHVEIAFADPVAGPLVIGDGRFLGLGVMYPVRQPEGIHAFQIDAGLSEEPDPLGLARALRRAVMARVQQLIGDKELLPAFFSGHEQDGSPARSHDHAHLGFLFDPEMRRLIVVAPHVLGRRNPTSEEQGYLSFLDDALAELLELRAGAAGCLSLRRVRVQLDADPLFSPSRIWRSVTRYQVTRHKKGVTAADAVARDIESECRRVGLPEPQVTAGAVRGVPGAGLMGDATIAFRVAVAGLIALGRSRHLGGGLFAGTLEAEAGTETQP